VSRTIRDHVRGRDLVRVEHAGGVHLNRNHVPLKALSRLPSGRHLGIGLGDRFGASQGESGSFEGGCGWRTKNGRREKV
jgi:hypothetical protein